jgi:pyruvate/2-oxoglutarate dehydrogenase complex dihydrolipoamide dehydrogenase (E3) component
MHRSLRHLLWEIHDRKCNLGLAPALEAWLILAYAEVMQESTFDFTVIGGGSAGYAAARTAHALGLRVAVIDGAKELSGLCILRGCMPSKALIQSAERNISIRRAAEFGLRAEAGAPDIAAIRERKRHLVADFAGYRQKQLQDGRWDLIRGQASFKDAHTVEVQPINGSASFTVRSRTWCIATGSVPNVPPIEGLAETGFWTSDELLEAESLPASFAVLGGGAIALEAAHYLEALGRKVTIIQRSLQLLSGVDAECSATICRAYARRGIETYLSSTVHRVGADPAGKKVEFTAGGAIQAVVADEVIVALGRNAATKGLDLQKAQVDLTSDKKIKVAATMQSSQPHVFAAGDVCSPLDVVHVAIQQGEIAARNAHRLLSGQAVSGEMDYRLLLFGVFSQPQVAVVGASEEQLREDDIPYVCASYPFDDHGKSMVMGETEGFVKLLAHRQTGEILGGCCVGPEATELIHEIVVAMHHRCTVQTFASIPHYHPTLSEIWTYPAEECMEKMAT